MIYLIDTIGTETGMHLYDAAFLQKCENHGIEARVISNYDGCSLRLANYYHGSMLRRLLYLFFDWIRLLSFRLNHHNAYFIYQSFGFRWLDIFFFILFINDKRSFLLVHDLYELNPQSKKDSHVKLKNFLYQYCVTNYICHSEEVKIAIEKMKQGGEGKILMTPHFEYTYSTSFEENNIAEEVRSSIIDGKVNFLFFGQVSRTKGINVLMDAVPFLNGRVNLIIAGMDKGHILDAYDASKNVKIINRYILDEELNYLFSRVDAVVLPYREIFQSGVLETVIHFKKPAILSPVGSFIDYLQKYPSFGIMYRENVPLELANAMNTFRMDIGYYSHADMEKYNNDHDISYLLKQITEDLEYDENI